MDHTGFPLDSNEFMKKLHEKLEELKLNTALLVIHKDMTEEELVHILSQIEPENAGLDFFVNLGKRMYEEEAYELLNVIKTHIEYNFDVEIVTKNGVANYEIRKRP